MSDVRQEALAQISRIKRTHDIADAEIIDHRELELLREGHGHPALGDTVGDRFASSASLAEWRESGMHRPARFGVPVLEAHELAAVVQFPESESVTDVNAVADLSSREIIGIAEIVPAEGRQTARPLGLSATELTTGTIGLKPGGATPASHPPSRELVLSARDIDEDLIRLAIHSNLDRKSLLDDRTARRIIDRLVSRHWMRGLARDLIEGDGSTVGDQLQLSGLASATITSIDAATGTKADHLQDAVAAVQGAGWEGPIRVLANPTDLSTLFKEAGYRRDRYEAVSAFVPFSRITAGTVWVAAAGGMTLFLDAVVVEVRIDHADDFIAGRAVVQPTGFAWADVANESAFAKVVNW